MIKRLCALAFVLVVFGVFVACPPTVQLKADFTYSPIRPTTGQAVHFINTSKNITGQSWRFGDGVLSEAVSPVHIYTVAGNYNVNLTVSGAAGTQKSVTKTVSISTSLVASFTWDSFAEAETPLQFTDTSAGVPTSWSWNFGDGVTATIKNPLHTYAAAGTFNVALTVTNAGGFKTVTRSVVVVEALKVNFTWTPTLPVGGQEVQFTDLSTGVGIVSWFWEFGDGGTSTLQNPKHTFTNATGANKDFTITLTVTNSHGTTASMTL